MKNEEDILESLGLKEYAEEFFKKYPNSGIPDGPMELEYSDGTKETIIIGGDDDTEGLH